MQNIIIAFSGKARSGKSQSSELLKEIIETSNDMHFQRLSFATAVKEIATYYFGWDGDKGIYTQPVDPNIPRLDGDGEEIIQDKGRQLLINIGSKFREIRPTIWADMILKQMRDLDAGRPENVVYCIDDLRFQNEVKVLETYGRTSIIRINRANGQLDLDDPTEKDLDLYRFERHIENDGSLDQLKEKIGQIYRDIIKNNK